MLGTFRDHTGTDRRLGHRIEPVAPLVCRAPAVRLPASQWVEFDDPTPVGPTDQGQFGACNGFSSMESLREARFVAGMPDVPLSAWFVYANLCGGVDQGSSIDDALAFLERYGTCPDNLVPFGTIRPGLLSATAVQQAQRFKVAVGSRIANFDELMSAVQLRRSCNFSVCVGGNFDQLDPDGVVGYSPGPGNHAISTCLRAKRARNGEWLVGFRNHWTTRWGVDGYGWVARRHVDHQPYFSAYHVDAATIDPADAAVVRPAA